MCRGRFHFRRRRELASAVCIPRYPPYLGARGTFSECTSGTAAFRICPGNSGYLGMGARSALPPLVVLVKKKGTTSGLRSANLQSGGYGGWRPRFSSFAGRRRQVRGRWGAGCLKSLAPEEHFSRFPAARLRGRAVPCAARCGAAAMRSSFRLFVPPNGLFLFFPSNTWSE